MFRPFVFLVLVGIGVGAGADPLPSWQSGVSKARITDFVERVTTPGPGYVVPGKRIAVFDNDGTLWAEQPMYFQLLFAVDRIRTLAPQHPEWAEKEPYRSILHEDLETALSGGKQVLLDVLMSTHAGMSSAEFTEIVRGWTRTARHPGTGRLYTEMVYQPMLELLVYLRDRDFKTYIVSGGGIAFMRVFAEEVYGIPPEQVIGSSIKTRYLNTPSPHIEREAELYFVDDKAGKPVAINLHIGRRPVIAFGNSDGDLQMLEWTMAGDGPRLAGVIHHTDSAREWAYDRDSHVGRMREALTEAIENNWLVVDMKKDWRVVFAEN